ncbi:MAG: M48 family metalloprotease [Methylobacillus sp.]|jgi:putative metalloprotease|nr:M48 family metalloprotease [Methylobacillus sp.]
MTFRITHVALFAITSLCFNQAHALGLGDALEIGTKAAKVATLSDDDLKQLTNQACAESDQQSKIAPAGSKYDTRLQKLGKLLGDKIDKQPVNYKVYMTNDVNAWAMANGCIRVYSGLMDLMNDDELLGVIGHEMGHVALGHSKKAMQTAYSLSIARDVVNKSGGEVAKTINSSQLGDLTEKFINAQFSQSQESAADDYSFDQLKARKLNLQGLVTAFQKLAELDGGQSSMMSSHPSSTDRAKHIETRIEKEK